VNDLDGAMRNQRRIEPTDGFHAQVMQAVRAQHASGRRSRRIEWDPFWASLAVASVVVPFLFAVRLLHGPEVNAIEIAEAGRWLSLTVAATLGGAWWFTRDLVTE
jgi:hypothetical protein